MIDGKNIISVNIGTQDENDCIKLTFSDNKLILSGEEYLIELIGTYITDQDKALSGLLTGYIDKVSGNITNAYQTADETVSGQLIGYIDEVSGDITNAYIKADETLSTCITEAFTAVDTQLSSVISSLIGVSGNYIEADENLSGLLTGYIDDKVSSKLDISVFELASGEFVLTSQILENFDNITNITNNNIPTTQAVSTFVDEKINAIQPQTPIITGTTVDTSVNYNRIIIDNQKLSFIPSGEIDLTDLSKPVTSNPADIMNANNTSEQIPTVYAVKQYYDALLSTLSRTNFSINATC
jgi:hypothetical protein